MSQCYVTMYRLESWGSPQLPIEINESIEAKNFKKSVDDDQTEHKNTDQIAKGHLIYEANVRVNNNNVSCSNVCKQSVAAMTGSSMTNGGHQNGNGTTGTAATEKGCWTVGLINSKFKYLSAETFGYKINANGKALKKKQVWILEPSGDGDTIVLRSHLNKYIAVDQFGNVTCDQVRNCLQRFQCGMKFFLHWKKTSCFDHWQHFSVKLI